MKPLIVVMALSTMTSCQQPNGLKNNVDGWLFRHFGRTLFESSSRVKVAELHLQKNERIGQSVIVSGQAVALGEGSTYFVLEDDKEKLVIILVNAKGDIQNLQKGMSCEVYGRVVTEDDGVLALEATEVKRL